MGRCTRPRACTSCGGSRRSDDDCGRRDGRARGSGANLASDVLLAEGREVCGEELSEGIDGIVVLGVQLIQRLSHEYAHVALEVREEIGGHRESEKIGGKLVVPICNNMCV